MTAARPLALVLTAAILLFGVVTLAALEAKEVLVLRTVDRDGRPRDTRTWVADDAGFTWVEAANPERPFLIHLRTHPDLDLVRAGSVRARLRLRPTGRSAVPPYTSSV